MKQIALHIRFKEFGCVKEFIYPKRLELKYIMYALNGQWNRIPFPIVKLELEKE